MIMIQLKNTNNYKSKIYLTYRILYTPNYKNVVLKKCTLKFKILLVQLRNTLKDNEKHSE